MELQGIKVSSDPYTLLGLSPTATADQVREAYRLKALTLHPDKHEGLDAADRKLRTESFIELGFAKSTLLDPFSRRAIDQDRAVVEGLRRDLPRPRGLRLRTACDSDTFVPPQAHIVRPGKLFLVSSLISSHTSNVRASIRESIASSGQRSGASASAEPGAADLTAAARFKAIRNDLVSQCGQVAAKAKVHRPDPASSVPPVEAAVPDASSLDDEVVIFDLPQYSVVEVEDRSMIRDEHYGHYCQSLRAAVGACSSKVDAEGRSKALKVYHLRCMRAALLRLELSKMSATGRTETKRMAAHDERAHRHNALIADAEDSDDGCSIDPFWSLTIKEKNKHQPAPETRKQLEVKKHWMSVLSRPVHKRPSTLKCKKKSKIFYAAKRKVSKLLHKSTQLCLTDLTPTDSSQQPGVVTRKRKSKLRGGAKFQLRKLRRRAAELVADLVSGTLSYEALGGSIDSAEFDSDPEDLRASEELRSLKKARSLVSHNFFNRSGPHIACS